MRVWIAAVVMCMFSVTCARSILQEQIAPLPHDFSLAGHLIKNGRFQGADGVCIYFEVYGHGDPIVLIHGLLGDTTAWATSRYSALTARLLENHQLILFDLRGHGRSDKPDDIALYGAQVAADVIGLMNHLGAERASVVSYSFGVLVTSKLLEIAPRRLNAVVLGGGLWARDGVPEDFEWASQLADQIEGDDGLRPILKMLSTDRETPPTEQELAAASESYLRNANISAVAALLRSSRALGILPHTMRENVVPTLVIMGEHDPNVPYLPEWLADAQNVTTVHIKDRDHLTAPADPAFAIEILRFLESAAPVGKY